MRISTNTIFEGGLTRMTELQNRLLRVQQQVSSGQRILSPSDDPVGAARALNLKQGQQINTQYAANRTNAKNSLEQEEGVLQSVTGIIQDLKATVVQAGNPTLDDNQRRFIALDLQSRFEELLALANSRDGVGNYLFSGYQITQKPFTMDSGNVVYTGDQGQTNMQVDTARQMNISDNGDAIFENIPSSGTFTAAMAATNAGTGTVSGAPQIIDARSYTGHNYDIVFNAFATTSPLQMAVSAAAANTGTARVSPLSVVAPSTPTGDSYDIVFAVTGGVTTYSVVNTTTAATVVPSTAYTAPQTVTFDSLEVDVTGAPADGDRLNVRPSTGSGTYSVYDVTLDPGRTGIPVSTGAFGTPQQINFDGQRVTVSGTPAANDVATVRPSPKQSIFKTMQDLVTLLQSVGSGPVGSANIAHGLGIANDNIDHALDAVLGVRASIGSRLKELEVLDSAGEGKNVQFEQALSDIQDLDYNRALSDLAKQQIILEAAQKSFARVTGLSLFDLL